MNLLRPSRPLSAIAAGPLVGMCTCLVLAAAPVFSKAANWSAALLVVAIVARLHLNRRAARLPSLALKIVLFALFAAGVSVTYGSMVGIEPGMSVLLVLVSLKLIETNSGRDFQVLALLGYFLCLCTLFFSQDLVLWLYIGLVATLITGTLVNLHRGTAAASTPRAVWLSAKLFLQALPIVVALFLLFPRSSAGFRFQFARAFMTRTGMSERLAPGSISSLAQNDEVAFRVDFPDGNAPLVSQMYWRGPVLWHGEGLTWVTGPSLPLEHHAGQLGGLVVRQRISLLPHGGRWIFALDRPSSGSSRFEYMPGGYLLNYRPIFSPMHYEIESRPDNRDLSPPSEQLRAALAPAARPSPRLAALVERLKHNAQDDREIVRHAFRFFREEKFSYSLEPGNYSGDGLDEFLFERRTGFCEHYAAAFAAIMRAAGVPARVVVGYRGGELNRLGDYIIVRQSDAHAWAEVWLRDSGWLRVDPTEAIAPERISSELASYFQTRREEAAPALPTRTSRGLGWRDVSRQFRLAWDSANYQWELFVLNFDEDNQRTLLAFLGLRPGTVQTALWIAALTLLSVVLVAVWLRRRVYPRADRAVGAWEEFCRTLAVAGLAREPWEGPMQFGRRAAAKFSAQSAAILHVSETYTRLRYAADPPDAHDLLHAVRSFPRLSGG